MISLEEFRNTDPRFNEVTDEELIKIRYSLYILAQLALESFVESKTGSKNPLRVYGLEDKDVQELPHD